MWQPRLLGGANQFAGGQKLRPLKSSAFHGAMFRQLWTLYDA